MLKQSLKVLGCIILAVGLLGPAGPARADWDPGDPYKMHYPQLPDLSDNALGVELKPGWLADDFLCTGSGPITGIHLAIGSESGFIPENPNTYPHLIVKIYSDIPASESDTGYSMPGEELWTGEFEKDNYDLKLLAENSGMGFHPNPLTPFYDLEEIWQVNIPIETEPFNQEEGSTYWLVLLDINTNDNFWMTSTAHWNDDAVWGSISTNEWHELTYPEGHVYADQSMDMAFVINTPIPGSVLLLGSGLMGLGLLGRRRKQG